MQSPLIYSLIQLIDQAESLIKANSLNWEGSAASSFQNQIPSLDSLKTQVENLRYLVDIF